MEPKRVIELVGREWWYVVGGGLVVSAIDTYSDYRKKKQEERRPLQLYSAVIKGLGGLGLILWKGYKDIRVEKQS